MRSAGSGGLGASVWHQVGDTQAPDDGDVQPAWLAVASGVGSILPSRVSDRYTHSSRSSVPARPHTRVALLHKQG